FVTSVKTDVIAIEEETLNAVGGNSRSAKIGTIGGAHHHSGQNRQARPLCGSCTLYCIEDVRPHGGGWTLAHLADNGNGDLVIGDHFLQSALHILQPVFRKHAAVHVGSCELRQRIPCVTTF